MNNKNSLDKVLREPEDQLIPDDIQYGSEHEDRFVEHSRDGRPHECKGSQCEDSDLKP